MISVISPFMIHLIPPIGGVPIGAIVLAMSYAPLIAIVLFRFHVAMITALLSPLLNSLITGYPKPEIIAILTFELILFSICAYLINRKWRHFWSRDYLGKNG